MISLSLCNQHNGNYGNKALNRGYLLTVLAAYGPVKRVCILVSYTVQGSCDQHYIIFNYMLLSYFASHQIQFSIILRNFS